MKVTRKNIMKEYPNTIQIGYCELQNLLRFRKADFCTSGIYGWNADIYPIDINIAIVTGYRPFGIIQPNYEIVKKYDEEALKIWKKYDYEKAKIKIDKLIEKFVKEVLKNDK